MSTPPTRTGHIALAGAPNVGKSSLLNRLTETHLSLVSPKPQATRLPVVGLLTTEETQFVFHDLPGLLEPSLCPPGPDARQRLSKSSIALM